MFIFGGAGEGVLIIGEGIRGHWGFRSVGCRDLNVIFRTYLEAHTLPLFLGYLVSWLGSVRYLKKGVGYEPVGTVCQAKRRTAGETRATFLAEGTRIDPCRLSSWNLRGYGPRW